METLPVCPAPDTRPIPPAFAVPPGACDCHAHIFEPLSRYPLQANRAYTPAETPLSALLDMNGALGIERLVLVQASAHGTDNRPFWTPLRGIQTGQGRGVGGGGRLRP